MKQIVLEADDFTPMVYLLPHLETLKSHIPNFKITLFTISRWRDPNRPVDPHTEKETHKKFFNMMRKYDWIELAQHGFDHSQEEFNKPKIDILKRLDDITKWNKEVGFEPVKIFRAPFWQASTGAYKVLRDKGWVVATDRNQVRPGIAGMTQYRWNWSIEEEMPDVDILKGHGHVSLPSRNNIPDQMEQLKRLPQDAQYLFVSEYVKKYGSD